MTYSKEDFENFKKDLDQVEEEILKGSLRTITFKDGPKTDDKAMMYFEDGLPKRLKDFFIVPLIFKRSEKVLQAEYKWDFCTECFYFTGNIKTDFIEMD